VGNKWGVPVLSYDDSQIVGTDRVAWVAPSTLKKIRRRLGQAQDDAAVFVALKREEEKKGEGEEEEEEKKEGEEEEEVEPPLEAWLCAWDEVPTGCMVLAGDVPPEWSSWAIAK